VRIEICLSREEDLSCLGRENGLGEVCPNVEGPERSWWFDNWLELKPSSLRIGLLLDGVSEEKNGDGNEQSGDEREEGREDLACGIDRSAAGKTRDQAGDTADQRPESADESGGGETQSGEGVDATNVEQTHDDDADVEQRGEAAAREIEQAEGNIGIHQTPRAG